MRKCKVCGDKFEAKYNTIQPTCSVPCAIIYGKKVRDKSYKAASKAFKKVVRDNDRSWHIKTCQTAFNRYIRLRDRDEPCISCQRYHQGQYHAGHFKSIGSAGELRFIEANCHKQCSVCNNHKSGNVGEYKINLIKKIGADAVEWLEGPHKAKKYTIEELKELTALYRQAIKGIEKDAQGLIQSIMEHRA